MSGVPTYTPPDPATLADAGIASESDLKEFLPKGWNEPDPDKLAGPNVDPNLMTQEELEHRFDIREPGDAEASLDTPADKAKPGQGADGHPRPKEGQQEGAETIPDAEAELRQRAFNLGFDARDIKMHEAGGTLLQAYQEKVQKNFLAWRAKEGIGAAEQAPPDVFGDEIKALEERLAKPDSELEDEVKNTLGLIPKMHKFYQAKTEALEGQLKALSQDRTTQASTGLRNEVSGIIRGLGDDWKEAFGDPDATPDKLTPDQRKHYMDLYFFMGVADKFAATTGLEPMSNERKVQAALAILFPGKPFTSTAKRQTDQLRNQRGRFATKPAGRVGADEDPDRAAAKDVAAILAGAGRR